MTLRSLPIVLPLATDYSKGPCLPELLWEEGQTGPNQRDQKIRPGRSHVCRAPLCQGWVQVSTVSSAGATLFLWGAWLLSECRFDVAFHQWTSQGQTSRHSRILFPPAIYFAFMLSSAFYEEKLLNMIQRRGSLEHQQHCCPLRIRKTRLNPQPPVGFLFPKNVVDVSL